MLVFPTGQSPGVDIVLGAGRRVRLSSPFPFLVRSEASWPDHHNRIHDVFKKDIERHNSQKCETNLVSFSQEPSRRITSQSVEASCQHCDLVEVR